jgi:hypothetical protein
LRLIIFVHHTFYIEAFGNFLNCWRGLFPACLPANRSQKALGESHPVLPIAAKTKFRWQKSKANAKKLSNIIGWHSAKPSAYLLSASISSRTVALHFSAIDESNKFIYNVNKGELQWLKSI